MKVERLNLENDTVELVDAIGIVRFVGHDKNADLTDGKEYYVLGFHENLLKLIDDSKDYYYYLPFDANDIGVKEAIKTGFAVVEDETGQITNLINNYKVILDEKQKKDAKKLTHRLIQWKLKRLEKNK